MIATPLPKLVNLRKEKDSDSRFMGQECRYKAIVEDPLVLRRGITHGLVLSACEGCRLVDPGPLERVGK